ncbi:uncharacterized protein LOC135396085 [Ornithodoros turicata]|uniref:uncharacterized protein LOC135396085 n=1 Tax=Ornithodoros turicata TaxID=34597 RepID=UPI003139C60A
MRPWELHSMGRYSNIKAHILLMCIMKAVAAPSIVSSSKSEEPGNVYYNHHLEDLIRQKLGKFGDIMRVGYHSLGIKATEPAFLEDTDVSAIFGGDAFKMVLTDVRVNGLSNYQVSRVEADVENKKISLSIVAPNVTSSMRYSIKGYIFGTFPVGGEGTCSVVYQGVSISTTARLLGSNGMFQFAGYEDSDVDYTAQVVSVNGAPPGEPSSPIIGGLHSQVGRVLFWTLAKQIGLTLPSDVLHYLNDALRRAPRPSAYRQQVSATTTAGYD